MRARVGSANNAATGAMSAGRRAVGSVVTHSVCNGNASVQAEVFPTDDGAGTALESGLAVRPRRQSFLKNSISVMAIGRPGLAAW
ncbi:MAG: hypothetical protein QOF92_3959 [Pseudonocardiales bacterium]|nr:hypothetical protein [Pseudonocardiales bacterium]